MLLGIFKGRPHPTSAVCRWVYPWTASVMHKHSHLLWYRFSNHLPSFSVVRLCMENFGTHLPHKRSRKQGGRDTCDVLRVLHLVPGKGYDGKEEGPSHHRIISDCMHDILGVQSENLGMKNGKIQFVNSSRNPEQILPNTIDSHDISACPFMNKLSKGNKFMLLVELHRRGISVDVSVLTSAVSFCAVKQSIRRGAQLHALLMKVGCDLSVFSGTSLISLYARCCQLENAYQIFRNMPVKNTVSWTALISGYAQDNQIEPCLQVFQLMRQSACRPNDITFATIFSVCTNHALLALGRSVHGLELRMGFDLCVHVSNALISMYAKCGSIDEAQSIFQRIACKDLVSWNSMIFGYSQYGLADRCLSLLKDMEAEHIVPDVISFLGILSSCRHACLVEEGRLCFKAMIQLGIKPELDHYSCMVDLLGRAGLLDEAWNLIHAMSMSPNAVIWGSLLAACRIHGNIPIGIHAAEHRLKLGPGCAATHIQLANLYASIDCWSDVARVRKMMKEKGLKTNTGCSWIEIGSKVYSFTAENRSKNHKVNDVLAVLDCLRSHMVYKYDVLIDGLEFDDPQHFNVSFSTE
ncbi:pentatricopeptide repeat-containing protein At2g37320-like isoform X1 [Lolium rigidum]|uniref:pentatricopeptide repeat-containing protein At2g37320-like isoform X1 n=2 Tax=Lolium rigidum TaxID=89674 RepID=UPI001F5C9098|nr:pentatricopeptide repeat-containing protein At2g37320-like isoform X1 [Lolium rigidum]XP_047055393.1 pentatricopeptide repeat-containing protein At2g37320-like isoform X1 [Lolium rigidum]XP_047055394.1 pentatricopeptide repeat-containing protein At2g37320-like isoform X1 [Lolium rigidum]XP_047055395.1 pentatricopeptide repeat-containing protein At2g37320-like isoform X1 [Lolium rigidum]XP_047055396.1 pentatricopeptide repeat-containing protein At2g37320-like isoform X1 [Lolium rigidum]XP_04